MTARQILPNTNDPRMSADEVLAEVDWFLAFDVHPALIAQELRRTPSAIEKMARKYGRRDLSSVFLPVAKEMKVAA
jgi:hypothetical protein